MADGTIGAPALDVVRVVAALPEHCRGAFCVLGPNEHGDVTLDWCESRLDEVALCRGRNALCDAGLDAVVWGAGVVVQAPRARRCT